MVFTALRPTVGGTPALADRVALLGLPGLPVAVAVAVASLPAGLPAPALCSGLVAGLVAALSRSGARCSPVFLPCSRGRPPGRLGAFLDHCCDAGPMRVSGSSHRFRHRELRHRPEAHPDPAAGGSSPAAAPAGSRACHP
ncbi:hypothetical protein [Kitasatospora cineracea]|uniref:Uncharacterized protein n=1 Tax=Kitasatospora cineracea TaxID=88074 RepID=A0A3N4R636_9ACTN|nr:hypothetical protein [Kitasatospora cineracea]RPE28622.1 hypothetical protein EDD38_5759 [Kitasatospora cineracea]